MAVIEPCLFYSANVPGKGLGLFCKVDMDTNDIWWVNDMSDPRYVSRVVPWDEYSVLGESEKRDLEIRCYVDSDTRSLIVCANPFWCINHACTAQANSSSDNQYNSIANRRIPAGEEILISYDYDAVISIVWKFDEFLSLLCEERLEDPDYLFQSASQCPIAAGFLERF